MKRFTQANFIQTNMVEPFANTSSTSGKIDLRKKLIDRLHRVFDKNRRSMPVVSIQYTGTRCEISISSENIYIASNEGTALYQFDNATTINDLITEINSYGILSASIIAEEYGLLLAKGFATDTIVATDATTLDYPTSKLWQEMQTAAFDLEDQAARIQSAEQQMYFHSSDSDWLDYWASNFFGIERYSGENDSEYRYRAVKELLRPTQNNIALENIVRDALGIDARILDAQKYTDEIPSPFTASDANNRFLLDMAIPMEMDEASANILIERVKTLVRKYKAAGTDFLQTPLRKLNSPTEEVAPAETYAVGITMSGIADGLQDGPIRVGAGWKVGTPGLKVGQNTAIKEQAVIQILLASDNSTDSVHLIGG